MTKATLWMFAGAALMLQACGSNDESSMQSQQPYGAGDMGMQQSMPMDYYGTQQQPQMYQQQGYAQQPYMAQAAQPMPTADDQWGTPVQALQQLPTQVPFQVKPSPFKQTNPASAQYAAQAGHSQPAQAESFYNPPAVAASVPVSAYPQGANVTQPVMMPNSTQMPSYYQTQPQPLESSVYNPAPAYQQPQQPYAQPVGPDMSAQQNAMQPVYSQQAPMMQPQSMPAQSYSSTPPLLPLPPRP